MYLTPGDDPLLGDPTGPLQDRVHLRCPAPLTVLGPTVGQQRQLDQTRINHRNGGNLPPPPLKPRPVRLHNRHPGLNHVPDIPLSHPIGQGIEGHRPAQCLLQTRVFGEGPDQPPQFHRVNPLIDHQHFDQAGTGQRTATRFIRIAIKDRLQVNALQSREQQRDDGDRLDHAKPLSGLIPHLSLPDPEKVRIAVTSHLKLFNKLYLYQRSTYGTGLNDTQLNWNDISSVTETYIPGDETVPIN